jgi:hypothetical protein
MRDLKGCYHLGDLDVDEMTIIQFILKICENADWVHIGRDKFQ